MTVTVMTVLIPVSLQLLDDRIAVDYTVEQVEREAAVCRYCRMNRTRYMRPMCGHHRNRWATAWVFGEAS